jgi:hypothetical protein
LHTCCTTRNLCLWYKIKRHSLRLSL